MVLLCIGLNAALQRRVGLEDLRVGAVNRATDSSVGIGGKGQGAYVAALRLARGVGGGAQPRLAMLLGSGPEGDQVASLLAAQAGGAGGPGAQDALWQRVASRCRVCTTLVDSRSGDATEIVEPSGRVEPEEWEALLRAVREEVGGGAAGCAVMGTTPPGVPEDGYTQLLRAACDRGTRVLVDSVVGVGAALAAAAERGCQTVVKLNAREVLSLAGLPAPGGSESAVAADPTTVARAALAWARSQPAAICVCSVCWTDGPFPGGVVDVHSGRRWAVQRQSALRGAVVSPIGAGDSTAAGTLHMWCRLEDAAAAACVPVDSSRTVAEAFAYGMAVGAASCLTSSNADFDMADVRSIHEAMEVSELPPLI
ncbi:unnamed protein product [Prorocentrum cordatum]|uniref:Carbohydrate kinase PfkB domain-containing protein n=1 Tax=Prorocentrum cordatum TaxID=2364126 RepID=A0ABN9SCZ9_9DINO|nr:unnamed protein product [Polarella glacialis]